jgi:hypothetical protein
MRFFTILFCILLISTSLPSWADVYASENCGHMQMIETGGGSLSIQSQANCESDGEACTHMLSSCQTNSSAMLVEINTASFELNYLDTETVYVFSLSTTVSLPALIPLISA